MKKILITTVCLLFVAVAFGQEKNNRYEHCLFKVNKGFSNGALTTDFVISKDQMDENLELSSQDVFFEKDDIFDVEFLTGDDGAIIRVFHLEEVTADDLKLMFAQIAGSLDYVIRPSKFYKIDSRLSD